MTQLLFDRYNVSINNHATLMNDIADTLLHLPWFEQVGQINKDTEIILKQLLNELKVNNYEIEWLAKDSLTDRLDTVLFDNSEVWESLKDLPTLYKEKMEETELVQAWDTLLNDLPEPLFHILFEKAYEVYQDEEAVRHLINQAYYVSTLIALAMLVKDETVANKLIELIKTGNVIVGLQQNKIYIV